VQENDESELSRIVRTCTYCNAKCTYRRILEKRYLYILATLFWNSTMGHWMFCVLVCTNAVLCILPCMSIDAR